jgi:hypothetical protein
MYLAWVVIAAGGYLSPLGHGGARCDRDRRLLAGAADRGSVGDAGRASSWRWWRGPLPSPAFVMAGLAAQMRAEVARLEDAARTDPADRARQPAGAAIRVRARARSRRADEAAADVGGPRSRPLQALQRRARPPGRRSRPQARRDDPRGHHPRRWRSPRGSAARSSRSSPRTPTRRACALAERLAVGCAVGVRWHGPAAHIELRRRGAPSRPSRDTTT